MAASSDKRRRVAASQQKNTEPADGDSDSGSEDSVDLMEDVEKEVQVDFEAVTPDDSDFDGIKRLLQQLFLKANIDLSELTDLLIKQNYVCSVVKQSQSPEDDDDDDEMDGDEDFGLISIVNLTSNKESTCVKQIKTLLLAKCLESGPKELKEKFQELANDNAKNIGLILSERFINIPPQIALPLYESLDSDLKAARQKGKPFNFDYYVFICKVYKDEKNAVVDSMIYANAEEELLAEESDMQFDYSVANEVDTAHSGRWTEDDEALKPYRRVLVLPASKWDTVLGKLKAELSIKTS